MKKNVWIINHYAGDMFAEKGGRHYSLAKYLKKGEYEPTIFCSNFWHNSDGVFFFDAENCGEHVAEEIGVPFVFVNTRAYKGNGKDRVLNMIDFYRGVKKAAMQYAETHGDPDVIIASSVHPLAWVAGIKLAKHYGVKCICEIRDLWPESLVAYEIVGKYNPITLALRRLEKWAYKKADSVVFTMEGAYEYIIDQGWEKSIPRSKVYFINNGVDLETFDYNKEHYKIDDPDLEDDSFFKVVYTGSIRKVNNLNMILNAAKQIKNPKVKLLIWGSGDELPALKRRVIDEKIENVVFKGKVEKWYVPYITSGCDLGIYHLDRSSIVKYGLSLNKMFDYFAAGLPVLTDCKTDYNPAIICNAGSTAGSDDPSLVAAEIERYASMSPEEMKSIKTAARAAAVKYDFSNLAEQLANLV